MGNIRSDLQYRQAGWILLSFVAARVGDWGRNRGAGVGGGWRSSTQLHDPPISDPAWITSSRCCLAQPYFLERQQVALNITFKLYRVKN